MWNKFKQWVAKWIVRIFPAPPDDNPNLDEKKLREGIERLKNHRPTPEDLASSPIYAPPEGIDRKTGVSHVALAGGESIVPYVGSPGETSVSEKQLRRMMAPKTGTTCTTCMGWGGLNLDCPDCGGKGRV